MRLCASPVPDLVQEVVGKRDVPHLSDRSVRRLGNRAKNQLDPTCGSRDRRRYDDDKDAVIREKSTARAGGIRSERRGVVRTFQKNRFSKCGTIKLDSWLR